MLNKFDCDTIVFCFNKGNAQLGCTYLCVALHPPLHQSSVKTKKSRQADRERRGKKKRRNVLITLKEASDRPTHIAEYPSHTNTHTHTGTHTKVKMNPEMKEKMWGTF